MLDIFNINTKKNIFSLFLVAILLSGTVTTTANTFFPTLSLKEAHAISSEYNLDKKVEEYDSNNYYQSNDIINKKDNIECTNFNLNANGLTNNDEIPESLRVLIKKATTIDQTQTTAEEIVESKENRDFDSTKTSSGNDDENKRSNSNDDKGDFIIICKNNNDNEQPAIMSPSIPPIPPPPPQNDNVYVVWVDRTNGGDEDIFYRVSHNNGETFEPFIDLSNNTGNSFNPQMVVSGNNVYVVWEDNTNGLDRDIFFRVSHDNGETFEPFIDLSNNTGLSFNRQMVVSGNNVYVVWTDRTNGPDDDIFFRVSHNNGETFEPFIDLSDNTELSIDPQMVVSGNNVYVVWQDFTNGPDLDIFFRVSHDNGDTFESFIDLSNDTEDSSNPQIIISENNIYFIWLDFTNEPNSDIFFRVSHDNGDTFESFINLSNNTANSLDPQMVVQ